MIKFDKLVDAVNIGIMILNRDLKVQYWNHWFTIQTHHHYMSAVGKDICEFFDISPLNLSTLKRHINTSLTLNAPSFFTVDTRHYLFPIKNKLKTTSSFEYMQQDVTILPYEPENGQVVLLVYDQTSLMESKENAHKKNIELNSLNKIANENIDQLKRAHKELETQKEIIYKQAHYDSLTGLPNRALLYEEADIAIKDSSRSNKKLGFMFLDLDKFKLVNDTMGHNAGDALLCQVAMCLQEQIRETDIVARLGGDEFVILLKHIENNSDVGRIAEKIIYAIRENQAIRKFTPHISASIGISIFPENGNNLKQLMKASDIALYQAKDAGRNNFQFFTADMNQQIHEDIRLEKELSKSLENGDFELYLQPQIESSSHTVIGAEALIRWHHPTRGLVLPGEFIPLTERTGLIKPLGKWIIHESCRLLQKWQETKCPSFKLSINLSPRQFEDGTLVDYIRQTIEETGVNPSYLEFEITENIALKNLDLNTHQLMDLKKLGVSISLDDFGTGYSSLSYLKELPIDTLKIDKSFIFNVPTDTTSTALTKLIIELANELGLKVVAEGIEKSNQKKYLDTLGCHMYQGFLFAKPMEEARFLDFLETP